MGASSGNDCVWRSLVCVEILGAAGEAMRRTHISTTTKLASALLARGDVPYEHAKMMHEDHIIELYQWHHNKPHSEEGGDHFSNLEPMLIAAHREQTAKVAVPGIAKNKRLRKNWSTFPLGLKPDAPPEKSPRRKINSRGFNKNLSKTNVRRTFPRRKQWRS
jgi:hypothetical protein